MIGLGLVAAALTLLVDGDTVAGISITFVALVAIWLSGVWMCPWGIDRYVLRVSNVLNEGSREATSMSRAGDVSLRELRATIEEMEPPYDCISIHREIVERMQEMDFLDAGGSDSHDDRAICMNIIHSDLMSARERLAVCHFNSRADQLMQLVDELVLGIANTRRATEIPLKEMSKRLRKMAVPRRLRDRHNQCESAVNTYLVALKYFNDARERGDAEVIRRAAQELSVKQAAMEKLVGEYIDELRAIYFGARRNVLRQSEHN